MNASHLGPTPPDAIPLCPSWCTSLDGHTYDLAGWGEDTAHVRQHVAYSGPRVIVAGTERNHLGRVSHTAPTVYVVDVDGEQLTAEHARSLALELLEAVNVLARITP